MSVMEIILFIRDLVGNNEVWSFFIFKLEFLFYVLYVLKYNV